MRVKLLKKLRRRGRDKVNVYSVTVQKSISFPEGAVSGMSIGYSEDCYSNLFNFGDTEEDIKRKASHVFMEKEIKRIKDKQIKP